MKSRTHRTTKRRRSRGRKPRSNSRTRRARAKVFTRNRARASMDDLARQLSNMDINRSSSHRMRMTPTESSHRMRLNTNSSDRLIHGMANLRI